jgi:poly(3-hydroxybutyrate) depolymerase
MQAVVDSWTRALDCAAEPRRDDTTDSVRTREYGPGRDGAEVVFITIGGLGHHWAGGVRQAPEFLLGATTDTLVATDVVWEFFRAHPAR